MNQMHEATTHEHTPAPAADRWGDLVARVEAQMAEADEAVARSRQHADSAARLRAVGTYRGVEITVDAQGLLASVQIEARAAGLPAATLAHAVQTAFRAALRDLVDQHRRCALQAWGDGATGRRVASEVAHRFAVVEPGPGGGS